MILTISMYLILAIVTKLLIMKYQKYAHAIEMIKQIKEISERSEKGQRCILILLEPYSNNKELEIIMNTYGFTVISIEKTQVYVEKN